MADSRILHADGPALKGATLTVDALAARMHMSNRTFARRFVDEVGVSPHKWLTEQRIQASLALLESSELSVEQIAARVGFESPATYRHHFVRQMHTTPSDYRSAFST